MRHLQLVSYDDTLRGPCCCFHTRVSVHTLLVHDYSIRMCWCAEGGVSFFAHLCFIFVIARATTLRGGDINQTTMSGVIVVSRASVPPLRHPRCVHVQSTRRCPSMRVEPFAAAAHHRVICVGSLTTAGAHDPCTRLGAASERRSSFSAFPAGTSAPPRGFRPVHSAPIPGGMWRPFKHARVGARTYFLFLFFLQRIPPPVPSSSSHYQSNQITSRHVLSSRERKRTTRDASST